MIRTKLLVTGLLGTVLLLASSARAQEGEFMRNEVAVQGTGFFTKDSQQNGTLQHSTNTGGVLVNYRFHFNSWLAAEAVTTAMRSETRRQNVIRAETSAFRPTCIRQPGRWSSTFLSTSPG